MLFWRLEPQPQQERNNMINLDNIQVINLPTINELNNMIMVLGMNVPMVNMPAIKGHDYMDIEPLETCELDSLDYDMGDEYEYMYQTNRQLMTVSDRPNANGIDYIQLIENKG